MEPFIHLARKYKLSGRCIGELCAHNAKVAQEANMTQVDISIVGNFFYSCRCYLLVSDCSNLVDTKKLLCMWNSL